MICAGPTFAPNATSNRRECRGTMAGHFMRTTGFQRIAIGKHIIHHIPHSKTEHKRNISEFKASVSGFGCSKQASFPKGNFKQTLSNL
jgi:hypothetical protein